jgi:hypothetical protein
VSPLTHMTLSSLPPKYVKKMHPSISLRLQNRLRFCHILRLLFTLNIWIMYLQYPICCCLFCSFPRDTIVQEFWEDSEKILRGFWEDSERILRGFWEDSERILRGFSQDSHEDSERILRGFLEDSQMILRGFWEDFERILRGFWEDSERILKGFWEDSERMSLVCINF